MNDKQRLLIQIALSQVGIHEIGPNSGPVVEMYQRVIGRSEKEPWCVSFLQWCVREVDKTMGSKTVLYPTESSQILWMKTPKMARLMEPEPGCVVVWTKYQSETPLSLGHVGIVYSVVGDGTILTVEGNTSPANGIEREGDGVYLKRRRIFQNTGPMRTTGFLLPWA